MPKQKLNNEWTAMSVQTQKKRKSFLWRDREGTSSEQKHLYAEVSGKVVDRPEHRKRRWKCVPAQSRSFQLPILPVHSGVQYNIGTAQYSHRLSAWLVQAICHVARLVMEKV